MNFKYDPHPTTEDHYHIQDLINGQEKRSSDRLRSRELKTQFNQYDKDISEWQDTLFLDWWCNVCCKEFKKIGKKYVDLWSKTAYYKTKCKCGDWVIRHITRRDKDPYFYHSKDLARQRVDHYIDTLQGFETNYNLIYGKK